MFYMRAYPGLDWTYSRYLADSHRHEPSCARPRGSSTVEAISLLIATTLLPTLGNHERLDASSLERSLGFAIDTIAEQAVSDAI
jgi:hypothetical protein